MNEENLEEFKSAKGLVLIFFADNPTTFKETIDMAVIAPEVAKVFQDHIAAKGFTDPAVGLTRLPAVGFYRDGEWLGGLQGLKNWNEYISGLAEIGGRTAPARRTISIQAN